MGDCDSEIDEDYRPTTIYNTNESHIAICFVVDTSLSMNDKLTKLNEGLNRFKERCCEEYDLRATVDVAIIRVDTDNEIIQPFCSVVDMPNTNLAPREGGSFCVPAIKSSLKLVQNQTWFYRILGMNPYKPWVVFITDGDFCDEQQELSNIARIIEKRVEERKIVFYPLCVEEYNLQALHKLSDKVIGIKGKSFFPFFDWIYELFTNRFRASSVPLGDNLFIDRK